MLDRELIKKELDLIPEEQLDAIYNLLKTLNKSHQGNIQKPKINLPSLKLGKEMDKMDIRKEANE
ncbi:MAG: hypothetical protein DWQ06_00170 [Calditrichaeota bacterium]|nr:MAG: hypothetical protein DWQ06_00170 [Calditrichota bacterium]